MSSELVRVTKGPTRPIIHDFQRAIMVDALKPVSFSFVMNSLDDFAEAARLFKPDIIFKNNAFRGERGQDRW